MGGCATKPKVLKGDEVEPFEPAPQEAVEEKKDAVKTAAFVEEDVKKDQYTAAADEDNGSKSRSLGNLFKENQEAKDLSQSETVKDSVVSEVKPTEAEMVREVQLEKVKPTEETDQAAADPVVDALAKEIQPNEVKPTEEAARFVDAPTEEVQPQELKSTVEAENAETDKKPIEKFEAPEEKNKEESKIATETEKPEK